MKNKKEKKEKPKYNIFQNTVYTFKNIWESGQKSLVIAEIIKIPVSFFISCIALYTPKIILDRLEFSENIKQIIAVIAALLIGTMFFELLYNFVESKEWSFYHRMWGYYNRHRQDF